MDASGMLQRAGKTSKRTRVPRSVTGYDFAVYGTPPSITDENELSLYREVPSSVGVMVMARRSLDWASSTFLIEGKVGAILFEFDVVDVDRGFYQ